MVNNRVKYLCLLLIAALFIYILFSKQFDFFKINTVSKNDLANRFTKSLNLKLISQNVIYKNSIVYVYNDTLVGLELKESNDSCRYFFQSLIGDKVIYYINSDIFPVFFKHHQENNNIEEYQVWRNRGFKNSDIRYFKNGYFYFPNLARGYIYMLGVDGSFQTLFKKNFIDGIYINKIFFSKDLIMIDGLKGIFILNKNSEKLVYKHIYNNFPTQGVSAIVGSYFIFSDSDSSKKNTHITCIDLNNLIIKWEKDFKCQTFNSNNFINDRNRRFVIPLENSVEIIDVQHGNTVSSINYNFSENCADCYPYCHIDSNNLYILKLASERNNSLKDSIYCYSIKTSHKKWIAPGIIIYAIKNKLIGYNDKYFYLINKENGKIETLINSNNSFNPKEMNEEYILIGCSVYK